MGINTTTSRNAKVALYLFNVKRNLSDNSSHIKLKKTMSVFQIPWRLSELPVLIKTMWTGRPGVWCVDNVLCVHPTTGGFTKQLAGVSCYIKGKEQQTEICPNSGDNEVRKLVILRAENKIMRQGWQMSIITILGWCCWCFSQCKKTKTKHCTALDDRNAKRVSDWMFQKSSETTLMFLFFW